MLNKLTFVTIAVLAVTGWTQEFATRVSFRSKASVDSIQCYWIAGQINFPNLTKSALTMNYIGGRFANDGLTAELFVGATSRPTENSLLSMGTATYHRSGWLTAMLLETIWHDQVLHSMAQLFWKWRFLQVGPEYEGYWRWQQDMADTWTVGPRLNFNFKTSTLGASWLTGNRNPVFRAYVVVNI